MVIFGFIMYVPVSLISWLMTAAALGARTGVRVGAVAALIGVGLIFLGCLLGGAKFGPSFADGLLLASLPIGLFAWSNGTDSWFPITFWIAVVALALRLLVLGASKLDTM